MSSAATGNKVGFIPPRESSENQEEHIDASAKVTTGSNESNDIKQQKQSNEQGRQPASTVDDLVRRLAGSSFGRHGELLSFGSEQQQMQQQDHLHATPHKQQQPMTNGGGGGGGRATPGALTMNLQQSVHETAGGVPNNMFGFNSPFSPTHNNNSSMPAAPTDARHNTTGFRRFDDSAIPSHDNKYNNSTRPSLPQRGMPGSPLDSATHSNAWHDLLPQVDCVGGRAAAERGFGSSTDGDHRHAAFDGDDSRENFDADLDVQALLYNLSDDTDDEHRAAEMGERGYHPTHSASDWGRAGLGASSGHGQLAYNAQHSGHPPHQYDLNRSGHSQLSQTAGRGAGVGSKGGAVVSQDMMGSPFFSQSYPPSSSTAGGGPVSAATPGGGLGLGFVPGTVHGNNSTTSAVPTSYSTHAAHAQQQHSEQQQRNQQYTQSQGHSVGAAPFVPESARVRQTNMGSSSRDRYDKPPRRQQQQQYSSISPYAMPQRQQQQLQPHSQSSFGAPRLADNFLAHGLQQYAMGDAPQQYQQHPYSASEDDEYHPHQQQHVFNQSQQHQYVQPRSLQQQHQPRQNQNYFDRSQHQPHLSDQEGFASETARFQYGDEGVSGRRDDRFGGDGFETLQQQSYQSHHQGPMYRGGGNGGRFVTGSNMDQAQFRQQQHGGNANEPVYTQPNGVHGEGGQWIPADLHLNNNHQQQHMPQRHQLYNQGYHRHGPPPQTTSQVPGSRPQTMKQSGVGKKPMRQQQQQQQFGGTGYGTAATTPTGSTPGSSPKRRASSQERQQRDGAREGFGMPVLTRVDGGEGGSGRVGREPVKELLNSDASRKRAELVESPATRVKFKEFYRNFRSKEKIGFDVAFNYAKAAAASLPNKIHWRVYLEMADLSKRENKFALARKLYQMVNVLQPYAPQGWLEYSKMEEECGELPHCQAILHEGLKYCSFSESLLTKAIKHEERMGNLSGARALLARLRSQSIEKAWRTVLEGALLEARAGHVSIARKVFKYLMKNVPWYGPIYHEAARFEERNEEYDLAITIVERGLREIPRYGPLWFNAFRLYEKKETEEAIRLRSDMRRDKHVQLNGGNPQLATTDTQDPDALHFWITGVGNDMSRLFGLRGGELGQRPPESPLARTRAALLRAMGCISKELVWKVHFEAAQVAERGGGERYLVRAREAYVQSVLRCPLNLRWKVWLAGARTELAAGNVDIARLLLTRALRTVPEKSRSQVSLERSRLEEYTHNLETAREVMDVARDVTRHEWKVFLESVMLEARSGRREEAIRLAAEALEIHSGTGRLWAILVQLEHAHGPDAQRRVFREALMQVPKSGEVWCEGARVRMHPLSPHFDLQTADRFLLFAVQFTPQYGDSFIEALRLQLMLCETNKTISMEDARTAMHAADTSALEQRCVNADPNYGALWFHCKRGPFDTARQVLRVAKRLLIVELLHFRHVYRYARGLPEGTGPSVAEMRKEASANPYVPSHPLIAESNNSCVPEHWLQDRRDYLPVESQAGFDFSTGLCNVNWFRERMFLLDDHERRKVLFGSDQIVP